jgi:hypothetical protein
MRAAGGRAERAQQQDVELARADVLGQLLHLPDGEVGERERGGGQPVDQHDLARGEPAE